MSRLTTFAVVVGFAELLAGHIAQAQTHLVALASFPQCADNSGGSSCQPSTLVSDSNGNLYGVATYGGNTNCGTGGNVGCGTVFEYTSTAPRQLLTLYTFCPQAGCTDGSWPSGKLIIDQNGVLYGTTQAGGLAGQGTVFKLTPGGPFQPLYSFCWDVPYACSTGAVPTTGLAYYCVGHQEQECTDGYDGTGPLFGTTSGGGTNNQGTVYEISTPGAQANVIYNFNCGNSGCAPTTLTSDLQENLFGTTTYGGTGLNCPDSKCGTVFELSRNEQGGYTYAQLVSFQDTCTPSPQCELLYPSGDVILDVSGNVWGTLQSGGVYGAGALYEYNASNQQLSVSSFTDISNGDGPLAGLSYYGEGSEPFTYGSTVFGTTEYGTYDSGNYGVVFSAGLPQYAPTDIYTFSGLPPAGKYPATGVIVLNDSGGVVDILGTDSYGGNNSSGEIFEVIQD